MLTLLPLMASAQDADLDGVDDDVDNCTLVANPDQHDDDGDLYGDVCDSDLDNNGTTDGNDIAEFKWLMGTGDLEPDLNGDAVVDYRDLGLLNARMGQAPGPRGVTAADVDPPVFQLDSGLIPSAQEMDGLPGFPVRNVGRMRVDGTMPQDVDVVLNEVVLLTKDPDAAADLASRWGGAVMTSFDPDATLGIPAPAMYLILVDPTGADISSLPAMMATLDPRIHGKHDASHGELLELLALIAEERVNFGLDVSMNVLMGKHGVAERTVVESAATMGGVAQPGGAPYTPNAFEWTMMEVDPDIPGDSLFPVDTRAMEAVRILDAAGRTSNRSRTLIWDGGFFPNADFPPFTPVGPMRAVNTDPSGCGTGSPPAPGSTCESHGTHVVEAGWGLPDNGFGTAGPGGAVTDLTLLQSPVVDVAEIVRFILESLPTALASRPQVLNISAGFDIPAGWCLLACPPLDWMTRTLTSSGTLVVASAGNASRNVDHEDEICILFFPCIPFESSASVPCELDDVLCVGATAYERSALASYSNWGSNSDANSVDIYAPGNVWSVNALNAENANPSPNDDLQIITGTSFAAPFVSGVANLVSSGRTTVDARRVRNCILNTAHDTSMSLVVRRRINAVDAVRCALGGRSHPFLRIIGPSSGSSFEEGIAAVSLGADADDAEDGTALTIEWTSSRDGFITTTSPGVGVSIGPSGLSRGSHILTATVRDSSGLVATDSVSVTVTNPLPITTIVTPIVSPPQTYYAGQTIDLYGVSQDPNETPAFGPLEDGQVRWFLDGSFLGTGHTRTRSASLLSPGFHEFCFEGTDDDLESGPRDCVWIEIVPVPSDMEPDVDLTSPPNGSSYAYPGGPVSVSLVWSANDDEDGAIPWSQTRVLVSRSPSSVYSDHLATPFADVTSQVNVSTICTNPLPPPLFCGGTFQTFYILDIEALPGSSSTIVRIKIEADDSTGNTGEDFNDVQILEFL
ncbi:MAG: hypothetical protein CMJ84_03870 [Planctomycetes bacterium]|nr:hypothetical protein [Planctomycetota bacterium]